MPDPFGQQLPLSSGYDVFVQPLPPYYKDLVEQQFPLPEYPKRKIHLVAGDIVKWPYEPPDEPVEEGQDDYDLYISWHIVNAQREKIESLKNLARVDYLLSMCVSVVDGELTVDDEEWVYKVEAAFDNFEVPKHKGKRHLYFLKHVVIRTTSEMDLIMSICTSPEVTMPGIINALHGFQDQVEEGRFAGSDK